MTKEETISKMKKDISKEIIDLEKHLKQMKIIEGILNDSELKPEEQLLQILIISIANTDLNEVIDLIQNKKRRDKDETSSIKQ